MITGWSALLSHQRALQPGLFLSTLLTTFPITHSWTHFPSLYPAVLSSVISVCLFSLCLFCSCHVGLIYCHGVLFDNAADNSERFPLCMTLDYLEPLYPVCCLPCEFSAWILTTPVSFAACPDLLPGIVSDSALSTILLSLLSDPCLYDYDLLIELQMDLPESAASLQQHSAVTSRRGQTRWRGDKD